MATQAKFVELQSSRLAGSLWESKGADPPGRGKGQLFQGRKRGPLRHAASNPPHTTRFHKIPMAEAMDSSENVSNNKQTKKEKQTIKNDKTKQNKQIDGGTMISTLL